MRDLTYYVTEPFAIGSGLGERENLLLYVLRKALWVCGAEGIVEEPDSENCCDASRVSTAGC